MNACDSPVDQNMKSGLIHVALIGVGGFGQKHLSCLHSEIGRKRFFLAAAADPCLERDTQARASLETQGCRTYLDSQQLLEAESTLEAVIIAAPIHLHEELVPAFVKRGLYVLLEKPPVPLMSQLEGLLKIQGSERVALGFQWIASGFIQKAKRWIGEGRLGTLQRLKMHACWPRLDGYYRRALWAGKFEIDGKPVFDGPATNALAHGIHSLMYLAGETSDAFGRPVQAEGELYRVRPDIESYDLVCLRGRFRSGATYYAALTHASSQTIPSVIEAEGSQGWIRIGNHGRFLSTSWGISETDPHQNDNAFLRMYENFAEFCRSEISRPLTSLNDSRGFLGATNGPLSISPCIQEIEPRFVRRFEQDGESGYEIEDIAPLIQEATRKMSLFSEMEVEWCSINV